MNEISDVDKSLSELSAEKDIAFLLSPENPVRVVDVDGVGECIAFRRIIPSNEGESTAEYYVVMKEKLDKAIANGSRIEWEPIPRDKITKVGGTLNPQQIFVAQASALWRFEMCTSKPYNDCLGEALGAVIQEHGIASFDKLSGLTGKVSNLKKYIKAISTALAEWAEPDVPEIFRKTDGNVVKRIIAISGGCDQPGNLRAVVVHELGKEKYLNMDMLKGQSILFPDSVTANGKWLPLKGDEIKIPVSFSFDHDFIESGWVTTVWGKPGTATEGKVSLCFVDDKRFEPTHLMTNMCIRNPEDGPDFPDAQALKGPAGLEGVVRAININEKTQAPIFRSSTNTKMTELNP